MSTNATREIHFYQIKKSKEYTRIDHDTGTSKQTISMATENEHNNNLYDIYEQHIDYIIIFFLLKISLGFS